MPKAFWQGVSIASRLLEQVDRGYLDLFEEREEERIRSSAREPAIGKTSFSNDSMLFEMSLDREVMVVGAGKV